jgi:hypothetical protein
MKPKATRYSARRAGRRGSAMVEAALSLTAALILIIGLLEVGILVMTFQGVSERARAGSRYALLYPDDLVGISNVVVYDNAAGGDAPLLGLKTEQVEVTRAMLDNESEVASVLVRMQVPTLIGFFVLRNSLDITVRVNAPIEGVAQ